MYKVITFKGKFNVFEINSEQILYTCNTHKEAKKLCNKLKNNIAFEGWTPSFFLNPTPLFKIAA
jgi:hypothetical protein